MKRSHGRAGVGGVIVLATGLLAGLNAAPAEPPGSDASANADTPRVTGVGGLFFKAEDPRALGAWYAKHLGIAPGPEGPVIFQWRDMQDPGRRAYTVWGPFTATTKYFDPSEKPFMFNYRVNDVRGMIEKLRAEGVQIAGEVEEYEYGDFGWIMDPEGNKIELWEPDEEWTHDALTPEGERAVQAALKSYYDDFSARDWEAYASHFHPGAMLSTVWMPPGKEAQELMAVSVPEFVAQADEGPGSQPIFEEKMTSAHVMINGDLATAWVRYEARFGTEENLMEWTGVDAFTLLRFEGEWKIISLAYASDAGE